MPSTTTRSDILQRVKVIMRRDLKLGQDIVIDDKMPFFGGDADIDSLDILLLLTSIEKEFGLKIPSEEVGRKVFTGVGTLVDYLNQKVGANVNAGQTGGSPSANATDPLARLPHGPPFRFVSRIVRIEPGQAADGIWQVSGTEPFFAGHFPGNPIVPGVLLAEALAQLSGLAKNLENTQGRLVQVDVRFDGSVNPPAEIQLHSRVTRTIGALIQYEVAASVGNAVVARGMITLGFTSASESP